MAISNVGNQGMARVRRGEASDDSNLETGRVRAFEHILELSV